MGNNEFAIKGKKYEVFFAEEDGQVEVYEKDNPGKTGFIFEDMRRLIMFINYLTDIAEKKAMEDK